MSRMVLAQLRRRPGRATALLLSLLIATTGFTVLTSSAATSRLTVTGTVNSNYRGAYDIVVRPSGSRTPLEEQRGLLRPNFLGGQFGGITVEQWRRIATISGVEVAAPIAMLGAVTTMASVDVDITDAVDRSAIRQVIRIRPTWVADRELTTAPDAPSFVYVTKRPVARVVFSEPDAAGNFRPTGRYDDGRSHPPDGCIQEQIPPDYEIQEDGRALPLCLHQAQFRDAAGRARKSFSFAAELTSAGTFIHGYGRRWPVDRLIIKVEVPLGLLAAAIDPAAEAALVGLDHAIVAGRYLSADEPPVHYEGAVNENDLTAPMLVADEPGLDERLAISVEPLAGARAIAGQTPAALAVLDSATATATARVVDRSAADVYRASVVAEATDDRSTGRVQFGIALQAGHVEYETMSDGALRPRPQPPAVQAWQTKKMNQGFHPPPQLAADTAFRPSLAPTSGADIVGTVAMGHRVGVFDRDRLTAFGNLSQVPLETYVPPTASGADPQSRDRLGGGPLLPNSNPGGYLTTSPTVLLSLSTVLQAGQVPDPISAIRVRVAGLTGFDRLSRERVRVAADEIAAATGLDVEVVLGASPSGQTILLPAGLFGRPELRLTEEWARKGVAAAIVRAIDRKSTVLFGLILAVCVLFLANALLAAVRDRRRDLAVLACLGWPRWRLAGLIISDVAAVGMLAGTASALLAAPLGRAIGVSVPPLQVWLALPVALGVALLAALVPAWRASQAHPGQAVHPVVLRARSSRIRRRRTVLGLATSNLGRVSGRTMLGAAALSIGVAGATLIAAVTVAFHGTVTGTLLGEAVSVKVRGVDTIAVVATLLLGLAGTADVLYLNVRERGAELAALQATGWSRSALGRLVSYEGLGIGLLGSVIGAGAGLAAAAWFADALPARLISAAIVAAGLGVVLACLAALIPALLHQRILTSTLLAED